jgi:hypothetical protein
MSSFCWGKPPDIFHQTAGLHVVTFLTACRNEGFNSKKRLDSFTNSVDFTHCLSLAGYFDEN